MPNPSAFAIRKADILHNLHREGPEYSDKSPKGQVDEQIEELIHDINAIDGLVTTSSCSGRISVFLESSERMHHAQKNRSNNDGRTEENHRKEGGRWLFSSHTPLDRESGPVQNHRFLTLFGFNRLIQNGTGDLSQCRCIHFKFEPMILHVITASLHDTQKLLSTAINAGLRESGAINFGTNSDGTVTPMVAIRSTGLASDTIIGYEDHSSEFLCVVDENYLRILVDIANDRFRVIGERIVKFRSALKNVYDDSKQGKSDHDDWEDPTLRKERKRAEGLRRQMVERSNKSTQSVKPDTVSTEINEDVLLHRGLEVLE